jgi:hypothetical protein
LIGSLLNQPEGIYNKVIKAHDDRVKDDIFETQLYRHHTRNVEFDENGNVIGGEQGILQKILGPVSRIFENLPILLQSSLFLGFLAQIFSAYRLSIDDQIKQDLDKAVQDVAEKANELYDAYLSFVVSGDYEIHTGEACSLTDALQSTQQRLNRIADQVNEIKRDLPYDSVSAYYYKHCLGTASNAIAADGKKAKKILNVIDQAVTKYNRGDQEVSALF